jgi:transposase
MLFPLAGGSGTVIKLGELLMILDLHRQGLSVSAIARHLCIDRKTVRSAIAKGLESPKYKTRPPRARITDPFEPYLKERLAAYPGLTAVRLWREVKERGYAGGYSVLRDCVRDLRPPRTAGFEVRFETLPGEQAQVDFAHFEVEFADDPGVKRVVWLFSLVLGYSRLIWGRFVVHQDLQSVLRCHIAALEAIGGAPHEILYDRMKTAVIGEDANGVVVYNRALVDLARHYGFQPRACRPYRPKTKGKVERPFRYIREDFFLGGSFRNLDDLNAQLRHWLDTVANPRVHATTQRVVNEAFADEKPALKPAARPLSDGPQSRKTGLPRRNGEHRRQSLQRAGHDARPHPRRSCLCRRDPHFRGWRSHCQPRAARGARPEASRPRPSQALAAASTAGRGRAHHYPSRRRSRRSTLPRLL